MLSNHVKGRFMQMRDELLTELDTKKVKGFSLDDNQILLHIENDQKIIVYRSLYYTNNEQAYADYLTLVNSTTRELK